MILAPACDLILMGLFLVLNVADVQCVVRRRVD